MTKRWKFLHQGFKSANGDVKWKIGKWAKPIKELELCQSGYHCSKGIYQAFSYVQGPILAQVECKGKHKISDDKEVWNTMRVINAYKWTKKDSVALAIYSAELVIDIFEKYDSKDKRPREAIEAAKTWLKNPTLKNKKAASASTAYAAYAAYAASAATAYAASAYAASTAAYAASAASASTAYTKKKLIGKIAKWMDKRFKTLKEIK